MSGSSAVRARRLNRTTSSTSRLTLRPWRAADAVTYRELWLQRDPRVPAGRRVDADGRPDLADLQQRIRAMERGTDLRPWVVEDVGTGEMLGYCGLLPGAGEADEPTLVAELLRRSWGQGYATEAVREVVERARTSGYRRLHATIWPWNVRAIRTLSRVGFVEVGSADEAPDHSIPLVLDL